MASAASKKAREERLRQRQLTDAMGDWMRLQDASTLLYKIQSEGWTEPMLDNLNTVMDILDDLTTRSLNLMHEKLLEGSRKSSKK